MSTGFAAFPAKFTQSSDEVLRLVEVAIKRGHEFTPRESCIAFLERVILESTTRKETADRRAYRRRLKKRQRASAHPPAERGGEA